jgi:PII-like signaling protein
MSPLDDERLLVRIYFGESDRWSHRSLEIALLERLRAEGFAGATVLRGTAGFGAKSVIHTAQILRLSQDLPVVVEVVDTEERVEAKLRAIVDEMVREGLVTVERVRVWPRPR